MFGINGVLFRLARDCREAGGDLRRMSNLRPGPRRLCWTWFTTNVKRAALGERSGGDCEWQGLRSGGARKTGKRLGFVRLAKRAITNVVLGAGIFSKKSMVL
jgi:hypothetical protein